MSSCFFFFQYREAVIEIRQLLTALEPLVKPVAFMGQASGKHGKGISQKNQLMVRYFHPKSCDEINENIELYLRTEGAIG